jgi:OOP family OmpA-OmpF porin
VRSNLRTTTAELSTARRSTVALFFAAGAWLLGEGRALAQSAGIALDRFDPAPVGSEWFELDSLDMRGSVRPAFGLVVDYAYKPLVLFTAKGSQIPIVKNQFYLHGGASLVAFDRVRLAMDVPGAVFQNGGNGVLDGFLLKGSNKPAIGDVRLDLDLRLFGDHDDPITMALGTQLFLPSGQQTGYTGDGAVRVAPHLLAAGQIGIFAYSASVGLVYHAQHQDLAGIPIGGELQLGGAAGLLLADKHLLLGPEIWGRTNVTSPGEAFTKDESPVEWLLGGHVTTGSWRFGLGGGTGFAQGLGSPELRLVGSVAFVPPPSQPQPPEDRDHDGIVDAEDACPDVKGIKTDDPATNGCPPPPPPAPPPNPDRDKDGILNEVDACPDVPGQPDPDPAKNGCPKAEVRGGQIQIVDQVKFAVDRADILPESDAVLEAVQQILVAHLDITKVDVEGHTDSTGGAAHNQDLSERRAASVVDWLVTHGIPKDRLTSHGFGQTRPIDSNATEAGRQNNRRVEFHIVKGPASGG